jgi:hypothetical protein
MANAKISKIKCDAAFYDDCHRRRRRHVGDSCGGPHLRPVTPPRAQLRARLGQLLDEVTRLTGTLA